MNQNSKQEVDFEDVLYRPEVGTICVAVPHGTDWGFDSLDPAGVMIKAYDGDYVWLIANRTHYITTHIDRVTFFPIKLTHKPSVYVRVQ